MAHMWPRKLPAYIKNDPKRSTEVLVFNSIEKNFSDDWHCFYSRPWFGLDKFGGEKEGEADFILANATAGLLFIEVKGGLVSWSPEKDEWSSVDRHGIKFKIKNPSIQADTCKFRFLKVFKSDKRWNFRTVNARHCVVLPHTPSVLDQQIAGIPSTIFCFEDDFRNRFEHWVSSRLGVSTISLDESNLGETNLLVVQDALAKPLITTYSLNSLIEIELSKMDQNLTGAQFRSLGLLFNNSRVVVSGGAGTGKTLLAFELISRKLALGETCIYATRSDGLREYAKNSLAPSKNLLFLSVDHLLADRPLPDLPTRLNVVVDEGQDFSHAELGQLSSKFAGQNVFLFMDSNQAIVANPQSVAERLNAIEENLFVNLRNTKNIGDVASALFVGPNLENFNDPGESVFFQESTSAAAVEEIVRHCKTFREQGMPPGNMAILCFSLESEALIRSRVEALGWETTYSQKRSATGICVSQIVDFKGLESSIVFVFASPRVEIDRENAYVAVSRARSRLFVIGDYEGTELGHALKQS